MTNIQVQMKQAQKVLAEVKKGNEQSPQVKPMTKVILAKQLKRNDLQASEDEYFSDELDLDGCLSRDIDEKGTVENIFSNMKTFQRTQGLDEFYENGTFNQKSPRFNEVQDENYQQA